MMMSIRIMITTMTTVLALVSGNLRITALAYSLLKSLLRQLQTIYLSGTLVAGCVGKGLQSEGGFSAAWRSVFFPVSAEVFP